MRTETQITADLIKSLRKDYFAMILNLHGHAMQAAGWPDFYLAHFKVKGCWIECKGLRTPVQPLQRKMMADLLKRGESVYILRFTNPKLYSLRTAPSEQEVIADIYGTYKEAAQGLLNEISKHQSLQSH